MVAGKTHNSRGGRYEAPDLLSKLEAVTVQFVFGNPMIAPFTLMDCRYV
jgi:hypothetical protein